MEKEINLNVEDIESAIICNLNSDNQFSMILLRKSDTEFIQTFDAIDTVSDMDENDTGTLEFVCERCGDINKIPNTHFVYNDGNAYPDPEVNYECQFCSEDYEIILSEDDVVDMIIGAFPEQGMEMYINNQKIK